MILYLIVLFFLNLQKIAQNKCYVIDRISAGGLANQIIIFQQILKFISTNFSNCTYFMNGPQSCHIKTRSNSTGFADFFSIRSVFACERTMKEDSRKHLCLKYAGLLKKSTMKFDLKKLPTSNLTIINHAKIGRNLCLPFFSKSSSLRKLLCDSKRDKQLPFFFELFEIKSFIQLIGQDFIQESGLKNQYATVHFRGGDFKTRNLTNAFHSFQKCLEYSQNLFIKNTNIKKIFVMSEKNSEVLPLPEGCIILKYDWIKKSILKYNYGYYANSIEFLKLLLEIYISSNGLFFVGNSYSTLSEIIIEYALIKNNDFAFSFVK